MQRQVPNSAQGGYDESDSEILRTEALLLLSLGILGLVFGILAWAAVDPRVRRTELWLVVVPLLGAALSTRFQRLGSKAAAALLIVGLSLGIIAAAVIYPDGHFLYALPLLAIVASALLGDGLTYVVISRNSSTTSWISVRSRRTAWHWRRIGHPSARLSRMPCPPSARSASVWAWSSIWMRQLTSPQPSWTPTGSARF